MASRRGWDHEKHLDMLFPKLNEPEGDYVFDELSSERVFELLVADQAWDASIP